MPKKIVIAYVKLNTVNFEGDAWRGMFPLPSLKEREENPMEEIWKDIEGYEGLYQVSDKGRVYGIKRNNILKPGVVWGYEQVVLCKNGVCKQMKVHRLVASAFCNKRENADQVNHINENKRDNRAENLEWCTNLENIRHGTGIKRHALSQTNNYRSKKVGQFTRDGELVGVYASTHDMQRITGFDRAAVYRSIVGKRPSAYGFLWRFI